MEHHREVVVASQDQALVVYRVAGPVHLGEATDEAADDLLALQAGQGCAQAVVHAAAERDVLAGVGP